MQVKEGCLQVFWSTTVSNEHCRRLVQTMLEDKMIECTIPKGTGDIRIFPLGRVQSRALSSALRYRYKLNYARKMDIDKVKIPVSWLDKKLTFKKFQKKGVSFVS